MKKNEKAIRKINRDYIKVRGWDSEYESMQNLLDHLRFAHSKSEGTKRQYCYSVNLFCEFMKKNPNELIKLEKSFIEKNIKNFLKMWDGKTAEDYMYNLKSFFTENRIKDIKYPYFYRPPRGERKRKEYIPTLIECWKMVEYAPNLKAKIIIICLFCTGLRNSTLRALSYGIVRTNNLQFKKYTIKNDLKKRKTSIIFMVTPGMKTIIPTACKLNIPYYVFLPEVAIDTLKIYLKDRKRKYGNIHDDEILFPTDYNKIPPHKRRYKPLSFLFRTLDESYKLFFYYTVRYQTKSLNKL